MCKKTLYCFGLWALLGLCVGFWGCQYDISLLAEGTAQRDGGSAQEPILPESPAIETTIEPSQEQDASSCMQKVACFRCSVDVAADEHITKISERLLLLQSQSAATLVSLVDCRRRSVSLGQDSSLDVGSRYRTVVHQTSGMLLAEARPSSSPQSAFYARWQWWGDLEDQRIFAPPTALLWEQSPVIWEQGRGPIRAVSSDATQDPSMMYFRADLGEAPHKIEISSGLKFHSQVVSPYGAYDLLFFTNGTRPSHAMSYDLRAKKTLSTAALPSGGRWVTVSGKEHLLVGEVPQHGQGNPFSVLKLFAFERLDTPLLSIPLPRSVSLSFPAWYDPIDQLFWLVLEQKVWVISAETAKVQELTFPDTPKPYQWLGARYGRLWAVTGDGQIGDWRIESGALRWRTLKTVPGVMLLGACNASAEQSVGASPFMYVFRGGDVPEGSVSLWTLAPSRTTAQIARVGDILSPAIMGRQTEFFQCYDKGFLYTTDSGRQFESLASLYGAASPFWRAPNPMWFSEPAVFGDDGAFRRLALMPAGDPRDPSKTPMRWVFLDFSRALTQEETVLTDGATYTKVDPFV